MKFFNKNKTEEEKKTKNVTKDVAEDKVEEATMPSSPAMPKGGDADSYRVVLSPHVTEKATLMGEQNKYIFRVAKNVSKVDIKKSVENLYKVEVEKVRIVYAKSKLRTVGRRQGRKPGFKKAIIDLKKGSKIDLAA